MTRSAFPLCVAAAALALAGCGAEEATETVTVTETETVTVTVEEEPPPEPEGPEPIGDFTLEGIETDEFPTLGVEVSYLVDVRAASHDATAEFPAFDRVVLEFEGTEQPSWRVTYVDPPIVEDGSGEPVEVEGQAYLELRLSPATGVDLSGDEPRETYPGPDRIRIDGHSAIEVVRIGDFEANLAWVIGVRQQAGFAAVFFEDPFRLVVDVSAP